MSPGNSRNELRDKWEQRASSKADTCSSVLFQGFPEHLNSWIHGFHARIINDYLVTRLPDRATVLDLGCGYGRLSRTIQQARNSINLIGLDFSFNYCSLYRRNLGSPVICGDIYKTPLIHGSMDAILAVTSLMYISHNQHARIIRSFHELLKPGGFLLLIDPGLEFMNIVRLIRPGVKRQTTGGEGFTQAYYRSLANCAGMEVLHSGGIPLFSILLPLFYLIRPRNALANRIYSGVMNADVRFGSWSNYTVHRWMLLRRPDNE